MTIHKSFSRSNQDENVLYRNVPYEPQTYEWFSRTFFDNIHNNTNEINGQITCMQSYPSYNIFVEYRSICVSWLSHTRTNTTFLSKATDYIVLFSHASAEVRGENTPERKFVSTGDRTHNHQVMSPTRSPLSHLAGTWETEPLVLKFPTPMAPNV